MDSARRSGTEDHNPRPGGPGAGRLLLQDPTVCRTRTGPPRKRRADHVFDVPPVSAGMATIGPSTGRLCVLRRAARRPARMCGLAGTRGSLERR